MFKSKKKTVLFICVSFISVMVICFLLLQNHIIDFIIEKKIETIMSSPGFSSVSQDYIKEHKKEYDDIISIGDIALSYMLKQFEENDESGLKGHIMAQACIDILGDKNKVKSYMTGEDWYSKHMEVFSE